MSLGEFPDKVQIYLNKDYFLWKWYYVEEVTEFYGCYNCDRLLQEISLDSVQLSDYVRIDAELPQMIEKTDEYILNWISENMFATGLNAAFFLPIFLVAFYAVPTYMVWMISNFA